MSDQKRANLITVNSTKEQTGKVCKTIRLCINLSESNENKYPELNYRELVKAEEQKIKSNSTDNGRATASGLDPFSDNDADVVRIAKQFEAKYGTSNLKSRKPSNRDEFADIGAGYDENDSFIDNTDGYDEMVPPEVDTIHRGFYINCGSLVFTSDEPTNKRALSSAESSDDSSDSSNDSESNEAKVNGADDTEPKKEKMKKKKRMRLSSEKNTSDDGGAGESVDSHSSDSLSSKRNPTSDNVATSDSSRDGSSAEFPEEVLKIMDAVVDSKQEQRQLDALLAKLEFKTSRSGAALRAAVWRRVSHALRISRTALLRRARESLQHEQSLKRSSPPKTIPEHNQTEKPTQEKNESSDGGRDVAKAEKMVCGAAKDIENITTNNKKEKWANTSGVAYIDLDLAALRNTEATPAVNNSSQTAEKLTNGTEHQHVEDKPSVINKVENSANAIGVANVISDKSDQTKAPKLQKSCHRERQGINRAGVMDLVLDRSILTDEETELLSMQLIIRLKEIIDELKQSVVQKYKEECEKVQEEKKRLGDAHAARRLPKRKWPWSHNVKQILSTLVNLRGEGIIGRQVLPLFPRGFVRLPTLLRQAGIKPSESKKSTIPLSLPTSTSITAVQQPVKSNTTMPNTSPDKCVASTADSHKQTDSKSQFSSILSSMNLPPNYFDQDNGIEQNKNYVPPTSIGSITITPVIKNNSAEQIKHNVSTNTTRAESVIRIKSPSAINEQCKKSPEMTSINEAKQTDKLSSITITIDDVQLSANSSNNLSPGVTKTDNIFTKISNPASPNLQLSPRSRVISNHLKEALLIEPHKADLKLLKSKEQSENKSKDRTSKSIVNEAHIARPEKTKEHTIKSILNEAHIPRPELVPKAKADLFAKPMKLKDVRKIKSEQILALDDSSSDLEVVEDSFMEYQHKKLSRRVSQESKDKDRASAGSGEKSGKEDVDIDIRKVMQDLRDLHGSPESSYSNSGINSNDENGREEPIVKKEPIVKHEANENAVPTGINAFDENFIKEEIGIFRRCNN